MSHVSCLPRLPPCVTFTQLSRMQQELRSALTQAHGKAAYCSGRRGCACWLRAAAPAAPHEGGIGQHWAPRAGTVLQSTALSRARVGAMASQTPQASTGAPGSGQSFPVVRSRREERLESVPGVGGALGYYAVRGAPLRCTATRTRGAGSTSFRPSPSSADVLMRLALAQIIAFVVFLFFGGMMPKGMGGLLRFRSTDRDGWSPCSNACGPGIQVRALGLLAALAFRRAAVAGQGAARRTGGPSPAASGRCAPRAARWDARGANPANAVARCSALIRAEQRHTGASG